MAPTGLQSQDLFSHVQPQQVLSPGASQPLAYGPGGTTKHESVKVNGSQGSIVFQFHSGGKKINVCIAAGLARDSSAGSRCSPMGFLSPAFEPIDLEKRLQIDNCSGWTESGPSGNFYHLCSF